MNEMKHALRASVVIAIFGKAACKHGLCPVSYTHLQETESSTDTADNLLKVYKKLLYNDLFDTKHRLENFFSY